MTGDETNNCDHGKGENIRPPIYWNPFNKVFQCHKCGQVFVPQDPVATPNYQNAQIGSKLVDDPVASNTGKELKCLFCGTEFRVVLQRTVFRYGKLLQRIKSH